VDVDEANSGSEALSKLCARRYELVISDWHMEPVTGLDLLKAVRGDPGLKQMLFIMITGESRAENVITARKYGVNGYIVKPFNAPTLKSQDRGGARDTIIASFGTRDCCCIRYFGRDACRHGAALIPRALYP